MVIYEERKDRKNHMKEIYFKFTFFHFILSIFTFIFFLFFIFKNLFFRLFFHCRKVKKKLSK